MAQPDETRLNSLAANGFRLTPEQLKQKMAEKEAAAKRA